jgi:hypothetical protein
VTFRLRDLFGAFTLVVLYLGLAAVAIRGKSGGEIMGLENGVLFGAVSCFALMKLFRRYTLRAAGTVLIEIPVEFPWRFHIALAVLFVVFNLAIRRWWDTPASSLNVAMPIGWLLSNLADRRALLCDRGAVYVIFLFPWSTLSLVQGLNETEAFLKFGQGSRALNGIVPPGHREAVEKLLLHSSLPRENISAEHPTWRRRP